MIAEIGDAATNGRLEDVKKLVQADPLLVTSRDGNGWTPLLLASYYDKPDIVQLLVSKGANVNEHDEDDYRSTAIHWAADHGRAGLIVNLVNNGADVHILDANRYTPLHRAAKSDHVLSVLVLLLCGADPQRRGSDGELAADLTESPTIHLLLKMAERTCWAAKHRRRSEQGEKGRKKIVLIEGGKWASYEEIGATSSPNGSSSSSTLSTGGWGEEDYNEVVDDDDVVSEGVAFLDIEGRRWPQRIVI